MRKTRLKILLAAAVMIMIVAAVCLIVKLVSGNKNEPKTVSVWLRTAEYSQSGDIEPVRTATYEYDEYGRCVKGESFDTIRSSADIQTISYDDATRQTTVVLEENGRLYQSRAGKSRTGTVYNAGGEKIREWYETETSTGVFQKMYVDLYAPYPDGKYGIAAYWNCKGDRVREVTWREYDETSRIAYWRTASDSVDGLCSADLSWEDIKAAAIPSASIKSEEVYDRQGHLTERRSVADSGERDVTYLLEYREDGTLLRESDYGVIYTTITEYDEQERVVRITQTENGEEVWTQDTEYEDLPSGLHRKTVHTVDFRSGSQKITNTVTEFDDNTCTEKRWIIGSGGQTTLTDVVVKDAQGHTIRKEFPLEDRVEELEYDQHGNLVKHTYTSPRSSMVTTFEYTELVLKKDKAAYAAEFYAPVIWGE